MTWRQFEIKGLILLVCFGVIFGAATLALAGLIKDRFEFSYTKGPLERAMIITSMQDDMQRLHSHRAEQDSQIAEAVATIADQKTPFGTKSRRRREPSLLQGSNQVLIGVFCLFLGMLAIAIIRMRRRHNELIPVRDFWDRYPFRVLLTMRKRLRRFQHAYQGRRLTKRLRPQPPQQSEIQAEQHGPVGSAQ